MRRFILATIALILFSAASVPAFADNFNGTQHAPLTQGMMKPSCHGWYRHGKEPSKDHLRELAHDPVVLAQVGPIDDLPLPVVSVLDPCNLLVKDLIAGSTSYGVNDLKVAMTFSPYPYEKNSTYSIFLIDTYDLMGGGDSFLVHELVHYYRATRRTVTLNGTQSTGYDWDGSDGNLVTSERVRKYGYDAAEECAAFTAQYEYSMEAHRGQTNVAGSMKKNLFKTCAEAHDLKE